jgi:hypothetical protein
MRLVAPKSTPDEDCSLSAAGRVAFAECVNRGKESSGKTPQKQKCLNKKDGFRSLTL